MKPIYVGTYKLGSENVRLQLGHQGGGAFWSNPNPKDGGSACIEVGADHEHWWQVVNVFLHEATEFSYYRMGLRYSETPDYASDNGSYLFVADHFKFSEATGRVAHFLAPALPDLAKAWKQWNKKHKK